MKENLWEECCAVFTAATFKNTKQKEKKSQARLNRIKENDYLQKRVRLVISQLSKQFRKQRNQDLKKQTKTKAKNVLLLNHNLTAFLDLFVKIKIIAAKMKLKALKMQRIIAAPYSKDEKSN